MAHTTSTVWHLLLQMALGCEVYAMCSCTCFPMHCVAQILVWCWWGILFITCFHDSFLMWHGIVYVMYLCHDSSCHVLKSLFCMLMGYSSCRHGCLHWDPFYAILVGCSSCMSLFHTDRSLLTKSSCSGTSLGATPAWGNFPCMIATSLLCTSSLLTTLNAAAYTILTPGPGDVVPLGWTPLSMAYVFMLLMIDMFLFFIACTCIIYALLKMKFNTPWK